MKGRLYRPFKVKFQRGTIGITQDVDVAPERAPAQGPALLLVHFVSVGIIPVADCPVYLHDVGKNVR